MHYYDGPHLRSNYLIFLDSGSPYKLAPRSFWHNSRPLSEVPCSLVCQNVLGSFCILPAQDLQSAIPSKALAFFNGKWCFTTIVRMSGKLIPIGLVTVFRPLQWAELGWASCSPAVGCAFDLLPWASVSVWGRCFSGTWEVTVLCYCWPLLCFTLTAHTLVSE